MKFFKSLAVKAKNNRIFALNKNILFCFLLPFLISVTAFAINGISPFGGRGNLAIDLYHMYATLIAHLHDIIYNGQGGMYSFNIGMGINYYTLFLTNVGSPLNAVIALFPKTWLTDLIGFGIVLKFGLSGLTMGWYLRYKWKECDFLTVIFASMYALCGYAVNYYWNIMWTDLLFLLPLCLIGIEEIISKRKVTLYCIATVSAMVCNYYIAALMCIFLLIYFIIAAVCHFKSTQGRDILSSILLFGGASFLSAGIASVCLLPVLASLQQTTAVSGTFPEKLQTLFSFLEVLKNHFPGTEANMRLGGLPHIYTGFLSLFFLPLYALNKRIPKKERIVFFSACAFIILCMNLNIPNYIWHGMHVPNDIPFRYSFVYSFLIAAMAYRAARYFITYSEKRMIFVAISLLLLLAIFEFFDGAEAYQPMLIATAAVTTAFSILYLLFRRRRLKFKQLKIGVLIILCAELTWGASWGAWNNGNMPRGSYTEHMSQYEALIKVANERSDGFFRMELIKPRTYNAPALYGYNGMTHFSSMLSKNLQKVMYSMGYGSHMYGTTPGNRILYSPNTLFSDSLFGIRYVMSPSNSLFDLDHFEKIDEIDDVLLFENRYAMPIGFMVEETVLDEWLLDAASPFEVQANFLNLATDGDYNLFYNVTPSNDMLEDGLEATPVSDGRYSYAESDTENPGTLTLTFTAKRPGPLYLMVTSSQCKTIAIETRDEAFDFAGNYPHIISAGHLERGEQARVTLTLGRSTESGSFIIKAAQMNMNAFSSAMADLSQGSLENVSFKRGIIKATANVSERGLLFTSIPYDPSFTLTANGKPVQTYAVGGGLLGAVLDKGINELEFKYEVSGLHPGAFTSLLCIAILIFWHIIAKRSERQEVKEEES